MLMLPRVEPIRASPNPKTYTLRKHEIVKSLPKIAGAIPMGSPACYTWLESAERSAWGHKLTLTIRASQIEVDL